MKPHDSVLAASTASIEWTVVGQRVLVGWQESDGYKRWIGRTTGDDDDAAGEQEKRCPTLWIGHDVENEKRMVVSLRVPIKSRTSSSKRLKQMFLVLPVNGMRVEVLDFPSSASNPSFANPGSACKQLKFHFETTSQVIMPVPRVLPSRPMDDMPGHLVLCLKSLCRVYKLELVVAGDDGVETALKDFAAVVDQGCVESLDIDPSSAYCSGQTGGFNRWDCYPITTDEVAATAHWNPYTDDGPPAYDEACPPGRGPTDAETVCRLQKLKRMADDHHVFSPLGEITWDLDACPSLKREAPNSPSEENVCSPSRKARLNKSAGEEEEQQEEEEATEVDSSSEMDAWVERVRRGDFPPSAQPPAHLYLDQRLQQAIQKPWSTIPRPTVDQDVRAPSWSRNSVTAKWRTEIKQPDAIFLDLILLLKRALERDGDAHNKYFGDFIFLGMCARKVVEAEAETTTPEVDFHKENFTSTRDRLMKLLIADAVAATATQGAPTKDSLPKNPVDQCERVRSWINDRVQTNADVDLYNEFIAMGQAAVRLRDGCVVRDELLRPQVAPEDDELWWDFEFARAACIATAFFKFS